RNAQHADSPFVLLAQPSLFDPSRAPATKHTAWAYCHVPNGSKVDMLKKLEDQVERFAPGFRECILARRVFSPVELESMDANLVGGDIGGGRRVHRGRSHGSSPNCVSADVAMLRHLGKKPIHLLVINSAWRRRARDVRLSRCQDGARESQRRSVTVRHWNKLRSGRFSFAPVPFSKSLERPGERQLVAVRIGHMKIAFSPGSISQNFW